MSGQRKAEQALEGIDERKRKTLTRLITGTSFVVPIVASYSMDALTINKAAAQANGSVVVSDRRLKKDIARVGSLSSGLGLYRFKYLWDGAEYVGVLAQEVEKVAPQAVCAGDDGFLRVNYDMLGCEMLTYAEWSSRTAVG